MKSIETRLATLRKVLGRDRPAALSVTFKDGHEAIVDAGIAVELARTGVVVGAKSVRGDNGLLPDLLTALADDDDEGDTDESTEA